MVIGRIFRISRIHRRKQKLFLYIIFSTKREPNIVKTMSAHSQSITDLKKVQYSSLDTIPFQTGKYSLNKARLVRLFDSLRSSYCITELIISTYYYFYKFPYLAEKS